MYQQTDKEMFIVTQIGDRFTEKSSILNDFVAGKDYFFSGMCYSLTQHETFNQITFINQDLKHLFLLINS